MENCLFIDGKMLWRIEMAHYSVKIYNFSKLIFVEKNSVLSIFMDCGREKGKGKKTQKKEFYNQNIHQDFLINTGKKLSNITLQNPTTSTVILGNDLYIFYKSFSCTMCTFIETT